MDDDGDVPLEIAFDLIEDELERLGGAANINRRDTPLDTYAYPGARADAAE
jgi:hypothetical protein